MQVHKEAIDKVPNSLPNRSNIEIEIYGMEGIPAADLKEHEKQRQGKSGSGSDDDDEPVNKRPKPEGLLGTAPGPLPSATGMMTGMMPPHPVPGMHPQMGQFPPHMGPPMMGHMGHLGPPFMAPPG